MEYDLINVFTDKTLKDFITYFDKFSQETSGESLLCEHDLYFDELRLPNLFMSSLMIAWLDSVSIYISLNRVDMFEQKGFESWITYPQQDTFITKRLSYRGLTRQETLKDALISANKIYNNYDKK